MNNEWTDIMVKLSSDELLRYCHRSKSFLSLRYVTKSLGFEASIGPLDGKVGATILDGTYFITSANQDVIYAPPLGNQREVKLRADACYGDDDPILWPQPYIAFHCHFGAIPRPDSLPEHAIMWWTFMYDDFARFWSDLSLVQGFGKLSPQKFALFKSSVNSLLSRIQAYKKVTPPERCPAMLHPMVKWLEHCLVQLNSVYATFRQVEFLVRDIQRVWLELRGLLNYMEIYKPRMDGLTDAAVAVGETNGVFTHSIRVAQDFFTAGLPCWLIRPASEFTDQVIHALVDLVSPEEIHSGLSLTPHSFRYPVIFTGSAASVEKYQHIYQFSRNFLWCSADPFNVSGNHQRSEPPTAPPPSATTSLLPNNLPAASSSNDSLCIRSSSQLMKNRRKSGQLTKRPQKGEVVCRSYFLLLKASKGT